MKLELIAMSDEQLAEQLDNSGKGKPPVYRKPLREILAFVEDRQGSLPIEWREINPEATERKTVIAGMKNALRADAKNGKEFARIAAVMANTDDALVTVVVKAAA